MSFIAKINFWKTSGVYRPVVETDEAIYNRYVSSCGVQYGVYEAFIHDSKPIMRIAKLIEGFIRGSRRVSDSNERTRFMNVAYKKMEPLIRSSFQEYATVHNMSLSDAIYKWLQKFERVFPDNTWIRDICIKVDLESWNVSW